MWSVKNAKAWHYVCSGQGGQADLCTWQTSIIRATASRSSSDPQVYIENQVFMKIMKCSCPVLNEGGFCQYRILIQPIHFIPFRLQLVQVEANPGSAWSGWRWLGRGSLTQQTHRDESGSRYSCHRRCVHSGGTTWPVVPESKPVKLA